MRDTLDSDCVVCWATSLPRASPRLVEFLVGVQPFRDSGPDNSRVVVPTSDGQMPHALRATTPRNERTVLTISRNHPHRVTRRSGELKNSLCRLTANVCRW